jgi:uncharacterized sulfatase
MNPALVTLLAGSVLAAPADRPNVLFVVVDDLACVLGCYGYPVAKSPGVDALAKRSLRFERAYCQYPVCNPSRTSMLTGLRPDSTGVLDNSTQFRKKLPNAVTLPELFRRNGYFTATLGKIFHRGLTMEDLRPEMDDPASWDLRRYFQATPTGLKGEGRNMTGGKLAWCRWLAAEGTDLDQPDGQVAAEAVRLIEKKQDKPWFLAVGFHKPHDPFIAPRKYFDLYPIEKVPVHRPPADRTTPPPLAVPGRRSFDFTDRERREFLRAYLAGVSFMDAQLGKLLAALTRQKLWDRTVIVFVGDHGYHLGEHGWWNKSTLFELSARVPLLVHAPGMKSAGKTCPRLVEMVDLYPTVAELCAVEAPAGLEGTSFRPLLDEPERKWKKAAFTQVQRGKVAGRSVRTERWRYTEWDGGKRGVELYEPGKDPAGYHNLAEMKEHAETVRALKQVLAEGWKAAAPER